VGAISASGSRGTQKTVSRLMVGLLVDGAARGLLYGW